MRNLKIQKFKNAYIYIYILYKNISRLRFFMYLWKILWCKDTQDVHNMKRCIKYQKYDTRYNF